MTTDVAADEIAKVRRANRDKLLEQYKLCMKRGTDYQRRATELAGEAESAADGYVEMRKEFRARNGQDGYGDSINDYKYGQYSEAQSAVKDNQWYIQRAIMFSNLSSMEFAKAAALMQHIVRIEARL